jgi:two-component system, OmpR family, response regulator
MARFKLLIVDDDAATLQLLKEAFETRGAEVRLSGSGAEARHVLSGWQPDLIISDLAMPCEDGFALMRRVRGLSVPERANVPAIACTADARPEHRERALHAGFDAVVPKPIDFEALVQTIVHVTGERGSRGDEPGGPSADPCASPPPTRAEVRSRSAPDS